MAFIHNTPAQVLEQEADFQKNHKIYNKISLKIDEIRSTKIRLMEQFSKLVLAYLRTKNVRTNHDLCFSLCVSFSICAV